MKNKPIHFLARLLLIVLLLNAAAWSAPTFVQGTGNRVTSSTTTVAATFSSTTVTGNLLVAAVSGDVGANLMMPVITDSASNDWKMSGFAVVNGTQYLATFYCENATGAASHAVTATNPSGGYMSLGIGEFSGMGANVAIRGWNRLQGTTTTPSTGTVKIGATADLMIAVATDGIWTRSYTKDSGWSAIYEAHSSSSFPPLSFVYQTGLTGNTSAGWTISGGGSPPNCAVGFSLRSIASGGATPPTFTPAAQP